jgi:hypothetical protein
MEPTSWFFHETSGTHNKIKVSWISEYVIGDAFGSEGQWFLSLG